MNKIVIIDNYDSFTYNLSHLIKETQWFSLPARHAQKIAVYQIFCPLCQDSS